MAKQKTKTIIKNTAFGYYRFSSSKQKDESIETQETACEAMAKSRGITITRAFADRAKSGRAEVLYKRLDFLEMLKILRESDSVPEYLILYRLDRLSRSLSQSIQLYEEIINMGMTIICASGVSPEGEIGNVLAAIALSLADNEDKVLSVRTRDGNATAAKTGQHMGSRAAFGYKVVNKKYYIDNIQAPIVKEIFQGIIDGLTTHDICNVLNEQGITTAGGHKWGHQTISYILHNDFYCGTYRYKSSVAGEIVIENNHPSIIDTDTFQHVQSILKLHDRAPKAAKKTKEEKDRYLLTGKVFCGECNDTMQGLSGKGHRYYACKTRRTLKTCSKENIPKDTLENCVYNCCIEIIKSTPNIAQQIRKVYIKQYGTDGATQIKKAITDINRKLTNIKNSVVDPRIRKNTALLDALLSDYDTLSEQLENYQRQAVEYDILQNKIPSVAEISEWLSNLGDTVNSTIGKQKVFDLFIKAVRVFNDHIEIFFTIGDDTTTPPDFEKIDYERNEKIDSDTSTQTAEQNTDNTEKSSTPFAFKQIGGAKPAVTQTIVFNVFDYILYTIIAFTD